MSQFNPYTRNGDLWGGPNYGQLSFGAPPQQSMFADNLPALDQAYRSQYQDALSLNQQNYQNILKGYQAIQQQQVASQAQTQQGYTDLWNQVMKGIEGVELGRKQDITDQYAGATGQAKQSLITRGLGNTTVQDAIQRGLERDKAKNLTDLASSTSQFRGGLQSQIGGMSLANAREANQANTSLGMSLMQALQGVQANYPSAAAYGNAAGQIRAAQEAQRNRQFIQGRAAVGGGGGGVTVSGGGLGPPRLAQGAPGASPYAGGGGYGGFSGTPLSTSFTPMLGRGGYQPPAAGGYNIPEPAGWYTGDEAWGGEGGGFWGNVGAMSNYGTTGGQFYNSPADYDAGAEYDFLSEYGQY